MKVFKFGGASVKDSKSVENLANIISKYDEEDLWIVISAMGKMTNLLEKIVESYYHQRDVQSNFDKLKDFHIQIIEELFPFREADVYIEVNNLLEKLHKKLSKPSATNYDKEYSQIVSYGELLSTKIVSEYLIKEHISNEWIDIRKVMVSDGDYRQANMDWKSTTAKLQRLLQEQENSMYYERIYVTQGFIAANAGGETTTLGREGSDFSGAIISWCLDAESLTIWKDVPGLMNADPKKFDDVVLLEKISYREALELSFYGASVIHPKTIKPLQNKQIPLLVKSFLNPNESGTIIDHHEEYDGLIPSFISKSNQVLVSISPRDFSMVVEKNISELYGTIANIGININLMQNSALNFSICFDYHEAHLKKLRMALSDKYTVLYNNDLELLTIRHYNADTVKTLLEGRSLIIEQKSRTTARYLLS